MAAATGGFAQGLEEVSVGGGVHGGMIGGAPGFGQGLGSAPVARMKCKEWRPVGARE